MNTITQDMRFRKSLLAYAEKHGVSKAARVYKVNRQYVYRWKKRYDGTWDSLREKSRRPHHHPNQHTPEEIDLIRRMRRRNPHVGLVVFWVKLRQKGYTRSIPSLWRILRKLKLTPVKPRNPKYVPKPYEAMTFPGQRIQVDVKHVPASCMVGKAKGKKFYQYTAIDEYSRFRYVEGFAEASTYTSALFLEHLLQKFPFPVQCIQTDNGPEFTKRFLAAASDENRSLFERRLHEKGIEHRKIRPYTPRHNGKVERSHRKDNENFYAIRHFYSLEDFKKQLAAYNKGYNAFPMRPLGWKSPKETLDLFLADSVTYV